MKYLLLLCISLLISSPGFAGQFVTVKSTLNFSQTVDKLVSVIKEKKLTHFTTIKHHEGAATVGLELKPTSLIIFGNPKVGTQFMQESQLAGIDLPLKLLVHQNDNKEVMVTFTKMKNFKKRHKLKKNKSLSKKVSKALNSIVTSVQ